MDKIKSPTGMSEKVMKDQAENNSCAEEQDCYFLYIEGKIRCIKKNRNAPWATVSMSLADSDANHIEFAKMICDRILTPVKLDWDWDDFDVQNSVAPQADSDITQADSDGSLTDSDGSLADSDVTQADSDVTQADSDVTQAVDVPKGTKGCQKKPGLWKRVKTKGKSPTDIDMKVSDDQREDAGEQEAQPGCSHWAG